MKKILLTQGRVALIDDQDYKQLNQWKWQAHQPRSAYTFYAVCGFGCKHKKMHRVILGLKRGDGKQVHHRDSNGLNNQRANLRVCTRIQNGQSSRKLKIGTSKYKGVYWNCRSRKWQSQIRVNKKLIHLGLFNSETVAALAYNQAALKHFGEFARINTFKP